MGHGVCLLLALSPFDFWPLGFVAPALVLLAANEQQGVAWGKILLSGVFYSLATTAITFGWIAGTIWRYTGQNYGLTGLLVVVYAIVFQIKFPTVFAALKILRLSPTQNAASLIATAAVLAVVDALAPELFPWSWGNGIAAEPHLRQLAALGSVYLVSFFATLLAAIVVAAMLQLQARLKPAVARGPLLLLAAMIVVGILFRYIPDRAPTTAALRVAIVQTNIGAAAAAKNSDADFAREAINRLFQQSVEALQLHAPLHLVLWPEAAMPFHSASPAATNRNIYSVTFDGALEYLRRRTNLAVIFHDMYRDSTGLRSRLGVRGSAGAEAHYFKTRLVPWGEYLPFGGRRWFPEAGNFLPATDRPQALDLTLGAESRQFTIGQIEAELPLVQLPAMLREKFPLTAIERTVRIQPLLCYEALYPADAQTRSADIIVNLASDAWFGDGIEGAQHASATMLRAVENGRPMLRAAMSGISFAVDNRGNHLVSPTGQGRAETLFAQVPFSVRQTPFSVLGMLAFYALMFAALWPWLITRLYSRK